MKRIISALLLLIVVSTAYVPVFAEEPQEIKVYVNGVQIDFGDNPPVMKNNRVLAPARGVFESIGALIAWNPNTKLIIIGSPGRIIELRIGYKIVRVTTSEGSRQIDSDVAPEIINGTTYLPLSIIAEAMNAEIVWNADERAAYFGFDGVPAVPEASAEEQSVPEVYAAPEARPAPEEPTAENSDVQVPEIKPDRKESEPFDVERPLEMKISGLVIAAGDSTEDVELKYGKFSAQSDSVYGYVWQELNSGKDTFALVGQHLGEVVAFYSNSYRVSVAGIYPRMSAAQLNAAVGFELPNEKKTKLKTSEGVITIYRNSLEDYSVIAVLAQRTEHSIPLTKVTTNYFDTPNERQLLEFINMERANRKIGRIKNDEALSAIARGHSKEMAAGNFLTSEDSTGANAFDRMSAKNITDYEMAAEIIGRDAIDAIEMYFQWMNSKADTTNILAENFNYAGVGVAPCPNNHKMYYTVDFVER